MERLLYSRLASRNDTDAMTLDMLDTVPLQY